MYNLQTMCKSAHVNGAYETQTRKAQQANISLDQRVELVMYAETMPIKSYDIKRRRQVIRYRAKATFRRPQIKQYTA